MTTNNSNPTDEVNKNNLTQNTSIHLNKSNIPGWRKCNHKGEYLLDYEKEIIKFIYKNEGRAFICVDDDTGEIDNKIETISFAEGIKAKKILIITANSSRHQWEESIKNWIGDECIQHISDHTDKIYPRTRWLIVDYAHIIKRKQKNKKDTSDKKQMESFIQKMQKWHPVIAIADEAHKIKDIQTKQAQSAFFISDIVKYFIMLTTERNAPTNKKTLKSIVTRLSIMDKDAREIFGLSHNRDQTKFYWKYDHDISMIHKYLCNLMITIVNKYSAKNNE